MSRDETALPAPLPDEAPPLELFETPELPEIDRHDVELTADHVTDQQTAAIERFQQLWRRSKFEQAQAALRELRAWRVCQRLIDRASENTLTVHLDSLVLADCYQTLFADPSTETVVYLTGMELMPGEVTINRRLRLDHDTQSAIRAAGDPGASFQTLRALDESGHQFLGHCHNHTHSGEEGLHPSDVDRDYQHRLEAGPYTAIGLIMSADGYVRLFTNDLPVNIIIHGTHVERLSETRLYLEKQARNASSRLNSTEAGDDSNGHSGDRSHQSARKDRGVRSSVASRRTRTPRWSWWNRW